MGRKVPIFDGYDPHAHQVIVHESGKRFVNVLAGRRGGKTKCGGREFVRRIFFDLQCVRSKPYRPKYVKLGGSIKVIPRLHYWAVAPDYRLSRVQQRELFDVLDPGLIVDWREGDKELWLKNNVLVEFKSAEKPEKLVAVGLDGLWVDETARLKGNAWNANLRPCLADKEGWGIFTTTPLGKNWWYTDIFCLGDPAHPDYDDEYANVQWKTVDNTAVPALVKEVAKARKTMPLKYFMREFEASLEVFAGQIYDNFVELMHVVGEYNALSLRRVPRDFHTIIAGVDWGYAHPGCVVLVGIRTHDEHEEFWNITELHEDRVHVVSADPGADTWVRRIKELNDWATEHFDREIEQIYCGADKPEYIDALQDADLPADKADMSVQPGIMTVSTLMQPHTDTGRPRLFYMPECHNLIEQKSTYKWKEKRDGTLTEEPDKKKDDAVDAERYAIYSYCSEYDVEIRYLEYTVDEAA